MGIFSGSYNKPGKGVDKNEPKKKGFFLFFDIIIHKFTKFLGANCLYSLVSLVWIIMLFFFAGLIFQDAQFVRDTASQMSADGNVSYEQAYGVVIVLLQSLFAVGIFTLWGSGPASAAYAYINRCFTRGTHAWIVSDGWDKLKENFKQGMFVVILDAVILVFGLNAAHFYYAFYVSTGSLVWMTLTYITALALIIYTMMHPYIYQIMITFECKIGAVYKNALLITIAKLPGNVFVTFICAAVTFLLINLHPIIGALIIFVFGLCLTRYPAEFYAARVIERSILKDMKEKEPQIEYIEEDET